MQDLKMASSCACGPDKDQQDKEAKLKNKLGRIKNKIVVMSGKGGVGKSTVAANLAAALSMQGLKVGLLDVDVHGPSIPRLLSLSTERPHIEKDYIEPVPWGRNLWVMSLGFMLPDNREAVIWRGPVKMGLIRQFLQDVAWGDLDYLIVDCPPGTGDEPMSALQLMGNDAEAIIVTTPQAVAIDDVRRSVTFCRELDAPILGILENMGGYTCPKCNEILNIFNSGGGEGLSSEMDVPFLGRIPLDPEVVRSGDEGYIYVKTHPESPAAQALLKLAEQISASHKG
ncbi:Mrp/NBP35 family ATP-binding protein [Desulfonatronovibrio magnus]|uniref:Mrp/NBP35 family ATP-binding protein n=1 Tax=Desulfonatronovibrio magnus TaxID=698827 RepID=UPI0006960EAF|nr:Mrp/NBP35 family ATP-binding protein [Desulfonatronovibrio magnus]RQD65496.1 MAG: ATP-binding protein [Desulfonatronovibrio sp. MSAO_Bac4]